MSTYSDQFFVIDPGFPPPGGTALAPQIYDLLDSDNDELIETNGADLVDGSPVTDVWPGDSVTIALADGTQATYTGTTFYLDDGRRVFTPSDGSILQAGSFVSSTYVTTNGPFSVRDLGPSCFTPGTLIATPCGERPVETLAPGDLVLTGDGAAVPVLFLHHRVFGPQSLAERPNCHPIRIEAGALGGGLPRRPMILSLQHRVVLRSPIIQRMFDCDEILGPVGHLTEAPGIARTPVQTVTYIHIVLARHEVLMAEGALVESLFLGPQAEEGFTPAEIALLRRRLNGSQGPVVPVRPLVRGAKLRKAVLRHIQNKKALCAPVPAALWRAAG